MKQGDAARIYIIKADASFYPRYPYQLNAVAQGGVLSINLINDSFPFAIRIRTKSGHKLWYELTDSEEEHEKVD